MRLVSIATVDAAHAEVIREALDGAGVAVQVVPLRPFSQLSHLRHQRLAEVDIQVPASDEGVARAALDRLQIEAEEAALAQAEEAVAGSGDAATPEQVEAARSAGGRRDWGGVASRFWRRARGWLLGRAPARRQEGAEDDGTRS